MIFVTVGTQLPFQRLVKAMDEWALSHPEEDVFIQTGGGNYQPKHCSYKNYTTPAEWERYFGNASIVVSHAGMGTILKCLDHGKPLVIMPRQAALGEHRNEHQLATAKHFNGFKNIRIATDSNELAHLLCRPRSTFGVGRLENVENLRSLIATIKAFCEA